MTRVPLIVGIVAALCLLTVVTYHKPTTSRLELAQLPGQYFVGHPGDDLGKFFENSRTPVARQGRARYHHERTSAKKAHQIQLWSMARPSMRQVFPQTPDWEYTPNSVGQGDGSIAGQETNVFDNGYTFPDYVRGAGGDLVLVGNPNLSPRVMTARTGQQQLWGGEYSSVGKFPVGYRGQLTPGGEWNVWALPTEEQMQEGAGGADCPCAKYDSPLQSIDEINVLDDLGNDPDGAVWNRAAPAETAARCDCSRLPKA